MEDDPGSSTVQHGRETSDDKFPKLVPPIQTLPKVDLPKPHPSKLTQNGDERKANAIDALRLGTESGLLHDHLSTSHSLSVPLAGNRIRRRSAPSMLEPIQEGLLGTSIRRNSGACSNQISLDKKDKLHRMVDIHETPFVPKYSLLAQRRRSDPIGLLHSEDKLKMFSFESRYPAPRRNSLVSATLDELTTQFELLDRRKKVVEETELAESEVSTLPPILITDS